MAKTTKKHFDIFKTECEKWIGIFGLNGWEVHFKHSKNGDLEYKCRASVKYYYDDRSAVFFLEPDWTGSDIVPNEETVKRDAFHEVSELLLARMSYLSETKCSCNPEAESARHEVIRTLENVLFPKY